MAYYKNMERVVYKAASFHDADKWDQTQQKAMTPQERMRVAKALRDRAYPNGTNLRGKPRVSRHRISGGVP